MSLRCQSARRVWPGRHQRNGASVVRGLVACAAGWLAWSCAGAGSSLRPRLLPMLCHLVLCFAHAPRRLCLQFRIGFVLASSASPRAQLCVQADRRGSLSFKPTAAVRRRLNAALDSWNGNARIAIGHCRRATGMCSCRLELALLFFQSARCSGSLGRPSVTCSLSGSATSVCRSRHRSWRLI